MSNATEAEAIEIEKTREVERKLEEERNLEKIRIQEQQKAEQIERQKLEEETVHEDLLDANDQRTEHENTIGLNLKAKNMSITRNQRRNLKKENLNQPIKLTEIGRDKWPSDRVANRTKIFRSKKYLVQEFDEQNCIRISVNRAVMNSSVQWDENITWDELQEIKREIGYGDRYAVEVFPKDRDVVNVANMRHLWVQPQPLDIGWVKT